MVDPKNKSPERMTLGEATIDDGPVLSSGGMPATAMSMESSSLLERSRVALIEHSRIALVALVDGTIAQLDADTQAMLRRRLKGAAAVLFVGFAAFLVKHLLQSIESSGMAPLILLQAGVTLILGFVGLLISFSRTTSILGLRLAELIIFGVPMVFFLGVQGVGMVTTEGRGGQGVFFIGEGPWLALMFTYALFIPNTLRRAGTVIAFMVLAPVVLNLSLKFSVPVLWDVLTWEHLSYFTLLLGFCGAGSVFGVQTIDTLRRDVAEARQLGQYRLKERIGVGGMGEVYKAEHQLLKRPCVIKLIKPEKAGDTRVLARFKREVRATSKLTHWNTIAIYDYGSTADGVFYYVMEYLPGMSLSDIIKTYGQMPADRVIHVLHQACEALAEAHNHKLIHRDVKPGNIFLAERGGVFDVVKLLDFGLVKPAMDEEDQHLTVEGAIIGSPLFMSPEQAGGDQPDARSDIYSLGAVGYYLLTGRPPFEGDR
jgi:tRNA A-37 threonylcarbamoyl transferase component Bud32